MKAAVSSAPTPTSNQANSVSVNFDSSWFGPESPFDCSEMPLQVHSRFMIEVSVPHTGLLRLGLATAYSVIFWSRATEDIPAAEIARTAEEQGWFGDISSSRVRYVVRQLQKRFPYPARKLLGFQPRAGSGQDALVCHWHLQLNDPLYRHYTSHYLLGCWSGPTTSVTLDGTEQWVRGRPSAREWKANTQRRMASGLMSAATEAGLI